MIGHSYQKECCADGASLDAAAAQLRDRAPNLQRRVQAYAAEADDPLSKKELLEALAAFEKAYHQEINAANKLFKNPKTRSAQDELDESAENAKVCSTQSPHSPI